MIDKHIESTLKAHQQKPMQSYLRIAWFIFCSLVVAVWTNVYFDESVNAKTCYVKENDNGTFSLVHYVDEGVVKHDNITNVSTRFEYLSVSYLAQGVLSLICVSY